MTLPGSAGFGVPPGDDWIVRKFRDIERSLAELRTARSADAATIGDGGIRVVDSDGHLIAVLGALTYLGNPATGMIVYRNDGSISFLTYSSGDNLGYLGYYDRAGHYVVTDDATSGQGLARPYVPMGSFVDNTVPTRTTTSTTFATLQTLVGYKQHPGVIVQVLVQAQSAGQVRMVDQNGTQVGPTQSFSAGAFEYRTIAGAIAGDHMASISLNLQARLTSGTSPIGVRGGTAIGVESAALP